MIVERILEIQNPTELYLNIFNLDQIKTWFESVTLFKPTEMINLTLPAAETTFCFENIDRLIQFD